MASREGYKLHEETRDEGLEESISMKDANSINDSTSISGFWSESQSRDENLWLTESCMAVLEPSKDESRWPDGTPINLFDVFLYFHAQRFQMNTPVANRPTRKPNHIIKVSLLTLTKSRWITTRTKSRRIPTLTKSRWITTLTKSRWIATLTKSRWITTLTNSRRMNLVPIVVHHSWIVTTLIPVKSDSWLIYIFQFIAILLSISEIVLGIIFYHHCEPQPSPILIIAVIMGIIALLLIYMWFVKVRRERRGLRYWNRERNVLSIVFGTFLFFLLTEVVFFTMVSPKLPVQLKEEIKCVKTYYDYLYYRHFAIGGSLFLAATLYLPNWCKYAFSYQPPLPSQANGHYQPL